jgi:hypothetical protein
MPAITLEVTHPSAPSGRVDGFRHLWAFYVKGFDPSTHCQDCFRGSRVEGFSASTEVSGETIRFDRIERYPYLYICGVGSGPKTELWQRNLHFPLRHAPGKVATRETYNGYVFTARDAEEVVIPDLPEGWNGRDRETTRCKNFRFGVEYFGADGRGAKCVT